MEKIPTAEEFIKNLDVVYVNKLSENEIAEITFQMVKFAKLHVEAALEAASENAEAIDGWSTPFSGNSASVDKDSILNAYPEENIK